jgi:hypothetical protein
MEEREEGKRATQGRTRPGRPGAGAAAPGARGAATSAGEGHARARERERRRRPPGREKGATPGRGNRRGRGAAAGKVRGE